MQPGAMFCIRMSDIMKHMSSDAGTVFFCSYNCEAVFFNLFSENPISLTVQEILKHPGNSWHAMHKAHL